MYILIVRDVTRRKQIEDELRRARDAAEAASRTKSTFLLTMSHELRTPLNHIIGYGEMIQEELLERGHLDLLADLQKIDTSSRQLLRQIDDVLDMANIESGVLKLNPQPFSLLELLHELRVVLTPLLEKQDNSLTFETEQAPSEMIADRVRVRQVLLNVLSNASKFTDHGTITVRIMHEEDDGRQPSPERYNGRIMNSAEQPMQQSATVVCEIRDTGIGMHAEQVAVLFEPFRVVDATTRKHGGAGLGLAITKRLCRLMGGDILVDSAPGQGSTFTLRLPQGGQ